LRFVRIGFCYRFCYPIGFCRPSIAVLKA
jgi:hypothetical protein